MDSHSPNKIKRRVRKSFEKPWRNRYVDSNLQEHWLEKLNALKVFDLISICEGHAYRRPAYPHIRVRLKEQCFDKMIPYWEKVSQLLQGDGTNSFNSEHTFISCELKYQIKKGRQRTSNRQEMILRLRRRQGRHTKRMDQGTVEWFEQAIHQIQTLDTKLRRI